MQLDITFFALAIPAAFIAGLSKGGFGGGPAFVATAILAIFLEPAQALGIMLPLLILGDLATLKPYWKQWDRRASWLLILGSVPGVALGAALYRLADADMLRIFIGAISVLFVVFQLGRQYGWIGGAARPLGRGIGLFAGLVSGFTSFVSHAGGPPSAMYLLSLGVGKTTYQATTVIVFTVINALKAVPYAFLGVFTWQTFLADLYLAPAMLIGIVAGVYAHHAMPERWFFRLTYALLLGAGLKLLYDGLA